MVGFIKKTVDVVFALLMAFILVGMTVSLAETVFDGWLASVVGVFIFAAVCAFLLIFKDKIRTYGMYIYKYLSKVSEWKLVLILGLFSAVTKIICVFLFDNNADLHPDMAMYRSFAEQFADSGAITEHTVYASKFNYTVIYGLIFSPFAKLFGSDTKVFTVALSVMNSLAVVMLFDIVKKYTGKEIPFFVLIVYCASPFGMLQTQLLTHENGLLFFHIFALWLFLKSFDKQNNTALRIVYLILSSLVLSIGKSINASGRVIFISFAIYAFVKIFEDGFDVKKLTKLLCVALSLIVFFAGASAVTNIIVQKNVADAESLQDDEKRLSFGWGLYLGLNYEHSGLWNSEDRDLYEKYNEIKNTDEALDYQKQLVKERLQFFADSPLKIPVHFFNKIKVLWGTQTLPFAYEQGNSINDFVLRGAGGIINKVCILFNGLLFIVVYAVVFISKVSTLKKKSTLVTPLLHFQMVIIGVTVALLLFEVTPKYATHMHILFFCILAMSVKSFFEIKLIKKKR